MKKILLTTVCFVMMGSFSVSAQIPTVRATYGPQYGQQHQADIKFRSIDQNAARFDITNPNGKEHVHVDVQGGENWADTTIKDVNTGQTIGTIHAIKDQEFDSVANIPGLMSHEIHLRKTGSGEDDISGTMKYNTKDQFGDFKIQNGKLSGQTIEKETGLAMYMYPDGSAKAEYRDVKTQKLLYHVERRNGYTKFYQGNGSIIAEGPEDFEDESELTIYDKKAYRAFEKYTDELDEEDDDEGFNLGWELL